MSNSGDIMGNAPGDYGFVPLFTVLIYIDFFGLIIN